MISEEDEAPNCAERGRYEFNMWLIDILLVVFYLVIALLVLISIIRSKPSRYINPEITGFPEPVIRKPSQKREEPGTAAREIQFTNINCSKCDQLLTKLELQQKTKTSQKLG